MTETRIFHRGLGLKSEVQAPLQKDYKGVIVDFARAHGSRLKAGDLVFRLAKEFGFCYGVDRAVEYAYEARARFPDRSIFITGEIIHNPFVNSRLEAMDIQFLSGSYESPEKFAPVTSNDVVLLPAFGVSTGELDLLKELGCVLVDTTCGSVLNVWKNVERYARSGFTSVVHGKYWHEETKATVSRATQFPDGHYLIVRDMDEASILCNFIEGHEDSETITRSFSNACSPGFVPQQHLGKIGLANQTTMLSSESQEIAARIRRSMAARYGEAEISRRFRSFDTICSATQERQDAVLELLNDGVDVMLVIGGYNSSNTTHLAEMTDGQLPTYHVSDPCCLVSDHEIRHKPTGEKQEKVTRDWLAPGPLTIGVTAGASTPDIKIDESIRRLLSFRRLGVRDLEPM